MSQDRVQRVMFTFLPDLDISCFISAQDLSYHFFLTVLVLLFFLYFRTGKVCLATSMIEFVNLLTALFTPDFVFGKFIFKILLRVILDWFELMRS